MPRTFSPQWLSMPGETIVDAIRERQLTVAQFANAMDEPLAAIDDLVAGRTAITISIARRLQETLGASVEFWMNRDIQFREEVARREGTDVSQWLSDLPVSDMIKFGWLDPPPHPSEEVTACLAFFGVPDIAAWRASYVDVNEIVSYRKSRALDSRPGAVAAWLRRGVIEGMTLTATDWDEGRFRELLQEIRPLTRIRNPQRFIPQLQQRCAECGVAVAVVRCPAGCRASGAALFFENNRALILLSSRFLTDDQFWFSFFHESGHLLLDSARPLVVDDPDGEVTVAEERANLFAQGVIVPTTHTKRFLKLRANSVEIIRFARSIGVSPGLVAGQMQHLGMLRPNQMNRLKRRYNWSKEGLVIREKA